jgi:hypothetical protein
MRHMGEWMYRSKFSWPQHWLEVSGQLHDLAALLPGKEPPVQEVNELMNLQICEKYFLFMCVYEFERRLSSIGNVWHIRGYWSVPLWGLLSCHNRFSFFSFSGPLKITATMGHNSLCCHLSKLNKWNHKTTIIVGLIKIIISEMIR